MPGLVHNLHGDLACPLGGPDHVSPHTRHHRSPLAAGSGHRCGHWELLGLSMGHPPVPQEGWPELSWTTKNGKNRPRAGKLGLLSTRHTGGETPGALGAQKGHSHLWLSHRGC